MSKEQIELRLKLCLRGIDYDLSLNTPISIERANKSMERAEEYKKQLHQLQEV
jgi:hypothetical protein